MEANVAPGYGPDALKTNYFRKRVLDLLGVKYVLHYQDMIDTWQQTDLTTFPKEQFALVYKIFPWQVYENKNSLPRAFLASDFILAKNKGKALALVYDQGIDLKKTVILEKLPNLTIDKTPNGKVNILSYSGNKVRFSTSTLGNQLLFFSDNYYPEWKVTIDGKPAELLIADYTFRGVAVPKGEHIVEFYYAPKIFELGLGIAFFGLLVLSLTAIYVKKNKS
jgi:hypothetical protein